MLFFLVATFFGALQLHALETPRCVFCDPETVAAQLVAETTYFDIILDYAPRVRGHLLIIPKRHIVKAHELLPCEWKELPSIIDRVVSVFSKHFGTDEYILWEKNGPKAFQEVPHVHFHAVPATAPTWGDIFNTTPRCLTAEELKSESLFFQQCFASE